MNELLYLPVTDRNGNHHEFGLLASGQWLAMYSDRNSDKVNRNFLAKLNEIESIKVSVDTGTATFRKENSKYWYAYKKLKGKLNKVYIGSSDVFTELAIVAAVEKANIPKSVTQNDYVTHKPLEELAGNKKDKNHIQQFLINETQAIAMAYDAIEILKKDVDAGQQKSEALERLLADQKIQILNLKLANADLEKALEEKEFDKQVLSINLSNITNIIDKHRTLASGKTKQGHPRFNKLLEFLEDIDKDSLSI
jgi:hypothetical protein